MNLKKQLICMKYNAYDPFCEGKYHFTLLEALFLSSMNEKKDREYVSIKHGPFYESILKHR